MIAQIKKVKSLALLQVIDEENHVELDRMDRLIIRKRVRRGAGGTARRRK
jgi:hypothetical protein